MFGLGFAAPWRLLLLLGVVVLIAAYLMVQRRRQAYAVRWTNLALLDSVAPRRPEWRRHLPPVAFLTMAALLVLAFAHPTAAEQVPRERATVVVAIDTSLSMEATDVSPDRIDAAVTAARSFIDQLPKQFNVGLVAFSGTASVLVPPTTDHARLDSALKGGLALGERTAIGEAVFAALGSLGSVPAGADGSPPPARIVLMSDGANTYGRSLGEAAAAATAQHVPISTIAYGTPNGSVTLQGQLVPVPVDSSSLQQLAAATGGTYFRATSGDQLRRVYADIGSDIGYRTETRDVSGWFVGFGLLAALAAAAASLRWFSRLP